MISLIKKRNAFLGPCCFKIDNLSVVRGNTPVLNDVSVHIHCGELTALIGPNGAGKSTLFKALIGDVPYRGEFTFLDANGNKRAPQLGYVPQRLDFDLESPISVLDLFAASEARLPIWLAHSKKAKDTARRLLGVVRAEQLLYKRLGDLSGGELQRVLLALALNPMPDLLLLDEPFSAVDQSDQELFYRLVSQLVKDFDLSVILVSHDLELAAKYAHRMVFLNRSVQSVGTPQEVFADEKFKLTFSCRIPGDLPKPLTSF